MCKCVYVCVFAGSCPTERAGISLECGDYCLRVLSI